MSIEPRHGSMPGQEGKSGRPFSSSITFTVGPACCQPSGAGVPASFAVRSGSAFDTTARACSSEPSSSTTPVARPSSLSTRSTGDSRRTCAPAAAAAGAQVRLESPVARVLSEDGRATGVVLEDGSELHARAVVSNADPLRTAKLAGTPAPEGWQQAGPTVKVMLLLNGLPDFPSWPGIEPWRGSIDIGYTMEDLARAAGDARAGRPAERPWIEAACQTAADDSLAPPGLHVL